MRRTYGLGYFGKNGVVMPPPAPAATAAAPQPVNVTVTAPPGGATSAEMAALRAELDALRNQRMQVVQTSPTSLGPAPTQAQMVQAGALTLPGTPTRGGEVVGGSGGQTQRELLTTPGQTFFTRSSDAPDANLRWDDWQRLKAMLPANFDEAKYLAKHPDVAEAVRKKAMPSGAWHYVMYGMPKCQAGEKLGRTCESRELAGWRRGLAGYRRPNRRPGFLAGYRPWR